jgi:DNA-binding response OmpR family regulator
MIKVLTIEDEPLISKLYQKSLSPNDFEVVVSTGGDALDIAKVQQPNIILLDVMMPDPNGIEVLKKLKSEEAAKNIPVVMLTNLSGKYDISYALSLGAVDYWIKDEIKIDTLGERIKAVLKL